MALVSVCSCLSAMLFLTPGQIAGDLMTCSNSNDQFAQMKIDVGQLATIMPALMGHSIHFTSHIPFHSMTSSPLANRAANSVSTHNRDTLKNHKFDFRQALSKIPKPNGAQPSKLDGFLFFKWRTQPVGTTGDVRDFGKAIHKGSTRRCFQVAHTTGQPH